MARRVARRRTLVLISAQLLAALVVPVVASATHRGDVVDEVSIQLSYQGSSLPGAPGQLLARLQVDDGSPIADLSVEFWREVEFLGARHITLGHGQTGADGTARFPIDPSESARRIGARFAGNAHYLAAEQTIEVAGSAVPPASPAPPEQGGPGLAVVSSVMPPVLALTALVIWLLLLGLTAATVRAIRRGRPSMATPRKGRI